MEQKDKIMVLPWLTLLMCAVWFLLFPAHSVFADTLKHDKDFVIQGRKIRFQGGTDIKFHATGDVETGFLAQDTVLPAGQKTITFRRQTMIAFYRSGNVHMGFLGAWAVLNYKGKKLIAPPGSYVEFDPSGELIKHNYDILGTLALRCRNADTWGINSDSPLYFTPGGRFVITKNASLPFSLWDMQNGTLIRFFKVIPRAFSPDGRYFLTAADADNGIKTVRIWNAKTWKEIKTVEGHMERIHYMDFTADSRKILAVNRDTEIKIWNADTGRLLKTVQMEKGGHKGHVFTMQFSPDGRLFASGGKDWTVRIWETDTGNLVKILNPDGGYISALDFSPDGRILAASCQDDNKIMLWDTVNWKLIRTINVKSRYLYYTEFSPDGKFILSAGQSAGGFDDNWQENLALKMWDVNTGKLIRSFSGHHIVYNASFSPDGKRIVSASTRDKSFKLWDVATGRLIVTFMTIGNQGDWMLYTPDGYYTCSDNAYTYESMSFGTGYINFTLEDFRLVYHKPDIVARYVKGDIPPPPQYVLFEMSHFEPEQNKRSWYVRYEYDDDYRRVKCRRYTKDGSPDGYYLYEYDSFERIVKESYVDNRGS
ncbi:MAG: WD40 repeat domain-containing protein, partial [Spirochaetales bacterium]|nr:WD40 repeat domain-containing protein [Spirochaetales bacterium]